MQCSSCRFENMPGSEFCGRCGTSLRLGIASIDVHPPRAHSFAKRFRRVMLVRRPYNPNRRHINAAQVAEAFNRVRNWLPLGLRMLVPGWLHRNMGQRRRGQIFLWSYLGLLLAGLLLMGSTLGSMLIGLAMAVHASSIVDIAAQCLPQYGTRRQFILAMGISLLLLGLLYVPLGQAIGFLAEPRIIQISYGPLEAGDVVLINYWPYRRHAPQGGDLVIYELQHTRHTIRNPNGRGNLVYDFGGERIDRVLAGPGDRIRWRNRQLTVNGLASPWLPLRPIHAPVDLEFTVPYDCCLILPTTMPDLDALHDAALWESLACVPETAIGGKVFLRMRPLRRFSLLH